MSDNVIPLFGLECAECTRPAKSHDFHTGMTIHLSPRARHCIVHAPRPHLSNGGERHEVR